MLKWNAGRSNTHQMSKAHILSLSTAANYYTDITDAGSTENKEISRAATACALVPVSGDSRLEVGLLDCLFICE